MFGLNNVDSMMAARKGLETLFLQRLIKTIAYPFERYADIIENDEGCSKRTAKFHTEKPGAAGPAVIIYVHSAQGQLADPDPENMLNGSPLTWWPYEAWILVPGARFAQRGYVYAVFKYMDIIASHWSYTGYYPMPSDYINFTPPKFRVA